VAGNRIAGAVELPQEGSGRWVTCSWGDGSHDTAAAAANFHWGIAEAKEGKNPKD